MRTSLLAAALLAAAFSLTAEKPAVPSGENCTFRNDPDLYLNRAHRERLIVLENTSQAAKARASTATAGQYTVSPADIPRRNFIDVEIFDRLAKTGTPSARLTTDEEFVRRIYLDLTGRIPTAEQVRNFVADEDTGKRYGLIDRLLYSPEFTEKWTIWLGDLLGLTQNTVNVQRQIQGRNAFHDWVRFSVHRSKSLKDLAYEAVTAAGNNFDTGAGAVNYILGGRQLMGPTQDWYDLMLYQSADKFLGLSHYDCLVCHDGRRHLDELSLWGKNVTRLEAQRMAAFFSRINITQPNQADRTGLLFNSFLVNDRTAGNYALGTTFGNRPNRTITGAVRAVDAEYRDGSKPGSANWRVEFAEKMVRDPMMPVNFANRLWKALFSYGLVEPVNSLDPARLDPDNPPPAPWQLQASHPKLLQALAAEMVGRDYNLREFIRLLVESSAYQLSSRYDAEWNLSHLPLFARHYSRRMNAEEIHDAIAAATGSTQTYAIAGWAENVSWAGQFPDPTEPRANGAVVTFLNTFLRGNREAIERSQAGSILQQLSLMNDAFITNRTKVGASPLLRALAARTDYPAVAGEMFLAFLSRLPSEGESRDAVAHLARSTTAAQRNAAVEDLAWALINKAEFIFSY